MADPHENLSERLHSIIDELAATHGLDLETCAELRDHLEDKVVGYMQGTVPVTEEDALLLARAHFGDAAKVASQLRRSRSPSGATMRPLYFAIGILFLCHGLMTYTFRSPHTDALSVIIAAVCSMVGALLIGMAWNGQRSGGSAVTAGASVIAAGDALRGGAILYRLLRILSGILGAALGVWFCVLLYAMIVGAFYATILGASDAGSILSVVFLIGYASVFGIAAVLLLYFAWRGSKFRPPDGVRQAEIGAR